MPPMRPLLELAGGARRLEGPLLFLQRKVEVGYNEAVEVVGDDGVVRLGRVAAVDRERLIVELLEGAAGLDLPRTVVRFPGEALHFGLGSGVLGRVLDGVGRPLDGGPPLPVSCRLRIDGLPLNPVARDTPQDFIETGVTAIDLMNSLVRGQKLPLFSAGGLPHDRIAVAIAGHARLRSARDDQFAIVFAGVGIAHDTAEYFRTSLQDSGALQRSVLFLNLAGDASTQRLLTPRYALTAAEYLAFVEGRHVLVIMTDMTAYCEALREVAGARGEVPARKGFPGYLYSDLASIYERAGCIRGRPGTLTQLPILTMPSDDIGHPVPDLSGYITEGQIVLSRSLDRAGVWPPVDVLPSLSRLMKDGTGEGFTDADHPALASQLYAAYARAAQARLLARVVGEDGLSDADRRYIRFGMRFEAELIAQQQPRSLEQSMRCAWELLAGLPGGELTRLSDEQIARHIAPRAGGVAR